MSGYSTAPVSTLLYQDAEPTVVFQKSFNTIAKRHHIRIWRAGDFEGNEVWLGAATHDAGVGFQHGFHDRSRTKSIREPIGSAGKSSWISALQAVPTRISYLNASPDDASVRNPGFRPMAGLLSSGFGLAREAHRRRFRRKTNRRFRLPVPRPSAWLADSCWKHANIFFATICTTGLIVQRSCRVRSFRVKPPSGNDC